MGECPVKVNDLGPFPSFSRHVVVASHLLTFDEDPGYVVPTMLTMKQVVLLNKGAWIHENVKAKIKEVLSPYEDFCLQSLRPLLYSTPEKASFNLESWQAYKECNHAYGEEVVESVATAVKEGKKAEPVVVWLQNYELLLAANSIRILAAEQGVTVQIGFVLYSPFPAWDVFRACPWSEEILQGLLACDLIAFQAESYRGHFIDSCQQRLGCRVDRERGLIEHGARACAVQTLPFGIPFEAVEKLTLQAKPQPENEKNLKLIITSDHVTEYVHALRAFKALLQEYPEHSEKVQLRKYWFKGPGPDTTLPANTDASKELIGQLETEILQLKTEQWNPLHQEERTITDEQFFACQRDASVAFLTPLREGVGLKAKGFAASQTETSPGVLVLSSFSAAAETMKEALICNPYQPNESAAVLNKALTMPEDERTVRMTCLRRRERKNDLYAWINAFYSKLEQLEESKPSFEPVTLDEIDRWMLDYVGDCGKLALLLDYDGTLSPLCAHPDLAILPAETREVLEKLAIMPQIFIAMISGRAVDNLKEKVGIGGITYAGSHGIDILHPDGTKYFHQMPEEFQTRADELIEALNSKVCRDGAWVEKKGALMTFHYRETPKELRPEIIAGARELIKKAGFIQNPAHEGIEAKPPVQWNKGRAAAYILCKEFGTDWADQMKIVFAGDDTTDEDAMEVLKGMAATFRIAPPLITRSWAEHRVPSTDSVLTLLKWIERHFSTR